MTWLELDRQLAELAEDMKQQVIIRAVEKIINQYRVTEFPGLTAEH